MIPSICRTLIWPSPKSSALVHKSPIPYPLFLFSFSTSIPQKTESKITIFNYLVTQQHFSPKFASSITSSTTKYLKKPQNADSVLSFLKESGFSKTHIERIVQKMPKLLSAKLEKTIKPKFKMFQDLGFDSTDLVEIISVSPWILAVSADNKLRPSILVLKNLLGSNANISALLKISSWFLKHDLGRTMIPNIEYLKSCGISLSQIFKYMHHFPRFFLLKPENIKGFVKRVDEMGVDRKSKNFLSAIKVVSSMTKEKWEHKLKLLREIGFSEEDILSVIRKAPRALASSEVKIEQVTQLLLSYEDTNITYIACHPDLLCWSVNQRLKPRLDVLKALKSKNLLKKIPSLTTVCKITNAQFSRKFVIPYSNELGDCSLARVLLVNNP
ncbi:hypothetical protein JCGZ_15770 [Jatropha curcas]|uniref:Uncharacterized protein n=1 Tax=Jatropha curcas TaxID=180498 RepID=A0A067L2B3_JATCU|nr:hypothetical protein JCGZ_15770 [Jatropha curcas]